MQCSNIIEEKSFLATLLLNWFLGVLGVHRFYTGYIGIGVVQLLTFGGCGVWALVDLVSICLDNYKDASGNDLYGYSQIIGAIVLVPTIVAFVWGLLSKLWS